MQKYNNTLQINNNNEFIRIETTKNYNQFVCQHTLLKPDLPSPGELRTNLLLSPTKQEEKKRERDTLCFQCVCVFRCVSVSDSVRKTLNIKRRVNGLICNSNAINTDLIAAINTK